MSLAVQIATDIRPQNGPERSSSPLNSGGSDEFSNVLESASDTSSGEVNTESASSREQANTESGGNAHPQDGNDLPPEEPLDNQQSSLAEGNTEPDAEAPAGSYQTTAVLDSVRAEPDLVVPTEVTLSSLEDSVAVLGINTEQRPTSAVTRPNLLAESQLDASIGGKTLPLLQAETAARLAAANNQSQVNTGNVPATSELSRVVNALGDSADESAARPTTLPNTLLQTVSVEENAPAQTQLAATALKGTEALRSTDLPAQQLVNARLSDQIVNTENSKKIDFDALVKDFVPTSNRESASLASAGTNLSPNFAVSPTAPQTTSNNILLGGSQNPGQLLTLATPVSDNAWSEDFAVRVRTLVSGNVQSATLNLRPADLGAIEVNLSTEGNETKAQFAVQTAAVREVLEASLPRLREIFAESGLSLADTEVRDQSFSQENSDQKQGGSGSADARSIGHSISEQSDNGTDTVDTGLLRWEGDRLVGGVDTFI